MKIRLEQLPSQLEKGIYPVYFVSGDEPWQVMQAMDMIRQKAQAAGYEERELLQLTGTSDWSELTVAAQELSLFSQQKLLDVRLETTSIGRKGSDAIRGWLDNPPPDKILLLKMPKLDKRTRNAAWVKALDEKAITLQLWDLSAAETLNWVAKHMRQAGLQPTQQAIRLLTERVEGNLLAAEQEISKLLLLFGPVEIDEEQVMQAVVDSSRFSVFDLSDAVLLGDKKRINHILTVLREEGTALQIVLWSLAKLSRQLHEMCWKIKRGEAAHKAIGFVPPQKKSWYQGAARRLLQADWDVLLNHNFEIDRSIKGQADVRIANERRLWDQLEEFAFAMAG